MIETLREILEGALHHLTLTMTTYLPPLLAGLTILLVSYALAVVVRWMLVRLFKGITFDRFLRQTGITAMIDRSGRMRATRLVAGAAFWIILGIGFLTALSAFNTQLTSRMIESMVFMLPKLVTAAVILLAGVWLAQYLGRSALVWAVNEGIPSARRLAVAVRMVIVFVAVVVAADHLDFARSVFLAAFVLLVGGAVLAASLALGLGGRDAVRRHFERSERAEEEPERSLWNHL
jgi:hypothetical protein